MENENKVKVYLCNDHFERLCDDNVCSTCPSKVENKDAVMLLATLTDSEKEKIDVAVVTELKRINTAIQQTHRLAERTNEDIRGDGNGKKGISTRLTLLEHDVTGMRDDMEEIKNQGKNYWSIAGNVATLLVAIIAIIVAAMV